MLSLVTKVCALLCLWAVTEAQSEGYYWRYYVDEIPSDAFPAGIDSDENQAYVGQTAHEHNTIPGHFRQNTKKLFYEFHEEEHAVENNIKIFCVSDPLEYEWVKTNTNEIIDFNKTHHLVLAGYQPETTTHIGRIFIDGKVNIGKVMILNNKSEGKLFLAENGRSNTYDSYEVLTYKKGNCDCSLKRGNVVINVN